jgi:hypothetical protein
MASAQVLTNGFVLITVPISSSSGRDHVTRGVGTLDLNMNFQFYAGGLDPDASTDVELISINSINGVRNVDTDTLSDYFIPINQIWNTTTNPQGDLDLVAFRDNSSVQLWNPFLGTPTRDIGDPVGSYELSRFKTPYIGFSDGDYWVEKIKNNSNIGQTTIVDKSSVPTNAMCAIYDSELVFEVRQGATVKSTTNVLLVTTICTDLDTFEPDSAFGVTVDLTVNLNGINQTVSPSLLGAQIQKAIIPYNKTTEREVVHLDYRIKSTD